MPSQFLPSRTSWIRTVLAARSFRRLWLAQIASEVGDWAGRAALGVLVYERTGSAAAVGALAVALLAPYLGIAQVLTARLALRDPRKVMISADVLRAGALGAVALGPPIPVVFALVLVVGMATPPFEAMRSAAVPDTVPQELFDDAIRLSHLAADAAVVAGYLAGGLALAIAGPRPALAADAVSFVVSALLIRGVALTRHSQADTGLHPLTGLRLIAGDAVLRAYVAGFAVIGGMAITAEALAAVVVHQVGGSDGQVGVLAAAVSAATIGATLVFRSSGSDEAVLRRSGFLACAAGIAAALSFALGRSVVGIVPGYLAMGVVFAARIPGNRFLATRAPATVRALLFSTVQGTMALFQMLTPVVAGYAAGQIDPTYTLAACGALAAVAGAVVAGGRYTPNQAISSDGGTALP